MKPMKLTSLMVMLLVGFSAAAQEEFFDEVYFTTNKKDKKEKIKKIGWNIQNIENIIPNTNVILIGSKKFINGKVFELKERQVENLEIIACYNYNEVKMI